MSATSPSTRFAEPRDYLVCNYIVLLDLRFDWTVEEVRKFDKLWRQGWSIERLSAEFGRIPDEIALLVMDRARCGKIQPRENGIFGDEVTM